MKMHHHGFRASRKHAASTLVEIALSLGIIGFALVGIVGTIPLALNTGRLSIAQSRAATVASSVFENFRSQPFNAAAYLDDGTTVSLDSQTANLTYFAYFDEGPVPSPAPADDRHLHFVSSNPTLGSPPLTTGACYQITLYFNNNPPGTFIPYQAIPGVFAQPPLRAEANGIEAIISESDRPNDVFRFSSVIANRTE